MSTLRARSAAVGRNTLRASATETVDVALVARSAVVGGEGEKARALTLSIDAFNVFNHPNFNGYVGNIRSPFFGAPTSVAPGRRLQLAAEMKFGG